MDLDLTNCDDNAQATRGLVDWCKNLGFDVELGRSGATFAIVSRFKWFGDVKASARHNHRLVLLAYFSSKKFGGRSQSEWCEFLNRVNCEQNVCKFCRDADGDMILQVCLHFMDKLSPRMLRNFLTMNDEALAHIMYQQESGFLGSALE